MYEAGKVIDGSWRILAPLSEGAMGAIYRAHNVLTGEDVALKVLHTHYLGRTDLHTRFEREAQALCDLRHPHIVAYHAHGADEHGRPFLVTELLQGYPADALLRRERPLSLYEVTHFVKQLCSALSLAHDRGVVHRDLKWSNVMVTPRASDPLFVKLIDFGIMKYSATHEVGDKKKLTRAGVLLGTPEYSSPEQILGKALDGRSDQYSLAVMAYELLAGRRPFSAKRKADLLVKHVREAPEPLDDADLAPPAYKAAVMRALAKKPEERFRSVLYFSRALEAAMNSSREGGGRRPAQRGSWVKKTSGRG